MSPMASEITSLEIVYSTNPVNSPHKRPVTRKMFPFDDVIMTQQYTVEPQGSVQLGCVLQSCVHLDKVVSRVSRARWMLQAINSTDIDPELCCHMTSSLATMG